MLTTRNTFVTYSSISSVISLQLVVLSSRLARAQIDCLKVFFSSWKSQTRKSGGMNEHALRTISLAAAALVRRYMYVVRVCGPRAKHGRLSACLSVAWCYSQRSYYIDEGSRHKLKRQHVSYCMQPYVRTVIVLAWYLLLKAEFFW